MALPFLGVTLMAGLVGDLLHEVGSLFHGVREGGFRVHRAMRRRGGGR